jgi:energy-coupling factor transport system permease protein
MSVLNLFGYKELDSPIHRLDPRVKFFWFFAFTLPAVAWTDPIWLTALFIVIIGVGLLAKQGLKGILKPLVFLVPALLFLLFFNLFFYGPTGLGVSSSIQPLLIGYIIPKIGGFGPYGKLTVENLVYAMGAMERLLIIATAGRLLLTFTSPSEVAVAWSKFHVPIEITTAVSIAFGFLPVTARQATSIFEAQKSRGWKIKTRNPVKALRLYIPAIIPTIIRSFARAEFLAAAISSRGFGYNPGKRTSLREIRMRRKDYAALALFIAFLATSQIVGTFGLNLTGYGFTACLVRGVLHASC